MVHIPEEGQELVLGGLSVNAELLQQHCRRETAKQWFNLRSERSFVTIFCISFLPLEVSNGIRD